MKIHILILALLSIQVNAQSVKYNPSFNPKKKTIELSTGITLRYVELGDHHTETVILLHGYTDTSRSFFPTIEELNRINPNLKIYALDQRGHGASSMPDAEKCASQPENCFAPSDFAKDVIAFMDQLNITQATLVGHSMGSIVAQELSISYPARVKNMIIIGSFANATNNMAIDNFLMRTVIDGQWKSVFEKQSGTWPQNAYVSKPSDLDTTHTQWIKTDWVVDPTADPDFIQSIYPETMDTKFGTWIGVIRALSKIDNRIRLTTLTVPTLVLWATQDNVFHEQPDQTDLKIALSKAASKNKIPYFYKVYGKRPLPQSGMQENDFGHNLQWGAPKEVAADIASFIKNGNPAHASWFADPENIKNVVAESIPDKSFGSSNQK